MRVEAVAFLVAGLGMALTALAEPWDENTPIATVTREVYEPHPKAGVAMCVWVRYVGPGLQREEIHSHQAVSDTPTNLKRRRSKDNGRTWTEFESLPPTVTHPKRVRVVWGGGPQYYDPVSKLSVSVWLHQAKFGGQVHNHSFVRTSTDFGRTWGEPTLLAYQPGDEFDPSAGPPWSETALQLNQGYFGTNVIKHSNGTLIHCLAAANAPNDPQNDQRRERLGSLCLIGTWDANAQRYEWMPGERLEISHNVSSRGLMEPSVAELKDGRVLVVWRGSNWRTSAPGRKFFSVSEDGGQAFDPIKAWGYDDGTLFYSPSSYHRFIRHSTTGKLYWIGNIVPNNPSGNSPRYPLVIAEVDETDVALKKDTVTLIDDRREGEGSRLQLSNFAVLDNRRTHDLEIYLTRYGEKTGDFRGADAYKYTLTFAP